MRISNIEWLKKRIGFIRKLGEQTCSTTKHDSHNSNANSSTYWQQRKKTTYRHRRANENRRSKNESREKNNDENAITDSFSRLGY